MSEPLTPEEYQKLLELAGQNDELAQQLAVQMQQAKNMREGVQSPQLRQAGRVVVAPHWMEALGGIAQQGAIARKDRSMEENRRKQANNRSLQNQMIMQSILKSTQPPPTVAGPGLMPPKQPSPYSFGGGEDY